MQGNFFAHLRKLATENNSDTQSILSQPPVPTKWLEIPFGVKFTGFPLRELGSTRLLLREKEDYQRLAQACQDWLELNYDVDQEKYEYYLDTRLASRIGLLSEILSPQKCNPEVSSRKSSRRRLRQKNSVSATKTCETSVDPNRRGLVRPASSIDLDFSTALSATKLRLAEVSKKKFEETPEKPER
jgi:hypothetical protein